MHSRARQPLPAAIAAAAIATAGVGCSTTSETSQPAAATSEPAPTPSPTVTEPADSETSAPGFELIPAEQHALDLAEQLGWDVGIAERGFNYATLTITVDPSVEETEQDPMVWRVFPTEHAQFIADGPAARQVDIDGHAADVIDEPDTLLYRVTCNGHIYEIDGYGYAPATVEEHMRQLVNAAC